MKIIISPDSFKGTMTAFEAANAIKRGIEKVDDSIEALILPVADGGEGTAEILAQATNGYLLDAAVLDPIGREIMASYAVLGDDKTCVIEMAAASGITLLTKDELNPKIASTFGTGQLIKDALDRGFTEFIICIGGSATNDAGVGMLRALGLRLLGKDGRPVSSSVAGLYDVESIDEHFLDPRLKQCKFTIASDVANPLLGCEGATAIFGMQKGIKEDEIPFFEGALTHWANTIERQYDIHIHDLKGAGAAGGMGSALLVFLNCEFRQGIEIVLNVMNYNKYLEQVDYIITGEGSSDLQTLHGKAPIGILNRAKFYGIPTILLSGSIEKVDKLTLQKYFQFVVSIVGAEVSLEAAMTNPEKQLEHASYKFFKQLIYSKE